MGEQFLSTRKSAPAMPILSKNSASWSRVMISKHHLQDLVSRDAPGAGAYDPKLPPSRFVNNIQFGRGIRPPLSNAAGKEVPGAEYDVVDNNIHPKSNIVFGKSKRFIDKADHFNTGPGRYETNTAFDGFKNARPFGISHRAYDKTCWAGYERVLVGKDSPGPALYNRSSSEADIHSKAHGFARSIRMSAKPSDVPGPGAYDGHDVVLLSKLGCVESNHRNPVGVSFGKPTLKARLDFEKIARTHLIKNS
jgi:hypothetical protein